MTLRATGTALSISAYPLSASSYAIVGGACDVAAGTIWLGMEGKDGLDARLSIGDGADEAFLSAKRIAANDSRTSARAVTVCINGTLVLGSGGIDLASPGGRVTLEHHGDTGGADIGRRDDRRCVWNDADAPCDYGNR